MILLVKEIKTSDPAKRRKLLGTHNNVNKALQGTGVEGLIAMCKGLNIELCACSKRTDKCACFDHLKSDGEFPFNQKAMDDFEEFIRTSTARKYE